MQLEQKISSHKTFSDVERTLIVQGVFLNENAKTFDLYYTIRHEKNKENVDRVMSTVVPAWHIDSFQTMLKRDENFQPIPNHDYIEGESMEEDKFLKVNAYEYVRDMVMKLPIPLEDILRAYILSEDADGRFDY